MRHVNLAIVVVGLCSLPMGCEKKAASSPTPAPEAAPAVVVKPADVIGTWVMAPHSFNNAAFNIIKRKVDEEGMSMSAAEIEAQSRPLFDLLKANPPEYTLSEGGTFTARQTNKTQTGSWTLEGDVVTLTAPELKKPATFRYADGAMEAFSVRDDLRTVTLLRKS